MSLIPALSGSSNLNLLILYNILSESLTTFPFTKSSSGLVFLFTIVPVDIIGFSTFPASANLCLLDSSISPPSAFANFLGITLSPGSNMAGTISPDPCPGTIPPFLNPMGPPADFLGGLPEKVLAKPAPKEVID